ncbi:sugar ABC transporter ATP-binding protein [Burkholderia gladioli]|jgi:simple sugar transport system ATP-binding protein|uniref:sugar ABC transporter ATP-binding protein n=1 Tax=Burkholderia gladioli TaxID=28095 RepID=UPI00062702DC|nr:sugar ABC transporter ATP-binding protein [Burkholderia gladioli]KKJ06197.1 lipase [Burkholderia gladioli]MBU9170703.1 sugar ABC transporter ATP-binding protein [Burkholderia gladioli]MBU9645424.1 sugar ABC transporter ATP-binding protein [Burkholderia gladioli]MDN7812673.1 sugar ABC transporter ATP-binding protein [Burkholderia gladioli]PEH83268.1 sugar ABC transporter ATP-binding protein [Burkholderia gladioli]
MNPASPGQAAAATGTVPAAALAPPLLQLENVSKTFGGVKALQQVSFEVLPGEVLCLAGENGCGKSTLIKIVSGVYQPEPGSRMRFDGEPVEALDPAGARRLGIQVIWQDLALFPEMTVAENIAFEQNLGERLRWVDYGRMQASARRILARLGVELDLERPVRKLSIAQRQIVAIARALVAEARLVFMDEPTASLSHAETEALLAIVRRLSADGIAVVFVSHRLAEVLAVCTRVTVMRDGRQVGTFPTAGMTQTRLGELMTGRSLDYAVRDADLSAAPVVLRVEQLTRGREYREISLEIRRGEILGLTGRLGAGRTELALSLFGMTRPESGAIELEGRALALRSNRDAIGAGIAYVSEDRLQLGLVQPQSIGDNTCIAVLDELLDGARLISPGRREALVRDWIRRLAVKIGHPDDPVSTLSGGNQQRVVLAKWLATSPKVLILDSPTVGVDVGARAGIFAIIRELAQAGMAILLISDEIPEVYFNADRILHMRDGRLVAEYVPGAVPIDHIERDVHA